MRIGELSSPSKRISEALLSFNDLSTILSASVRPPELQRQKSNNNDDQRIGNHAGLNSRVVSWLILGPEYRASNNTTNTTEAYESCRAKRPLPLPSDIVGLVCQHGGHVRVGADCGEEDSEITDAVVVCEAKEWKTDQSYDGVKDDCWTAQAHSVSVVCFSKHHDCRCRIRWSNKALCLCQREAHAVAEAAEDQFQNLHCEI